MYKRAQWSIPRTINIKISMCAQIVISVMVSTCVGTINIKISMCAQIVISVMVSTCVVTDKYGQYICGDR